MLQEEEPASEWVPDGQESQVSFAPTLKLFSVQLSVPVLPLLGFVPAPAVKQKAAPGPEYSPASTHSAHTSRTPEGEYFEAMQLMQLEEADS